MCNSASDCLICCMKNIRGKVRALLTSYFHSHSTNDQAGSEHRHRPLVFVPHPPRECKPTSEINFERKKRFRELWLDFVFRPVCLVCFDRKGGVEEEGDGGGGRQMQAILMRCITLVS